MINKTNLSVHSDVRGDLFVYENSASNSFFSKHNTLIVLSKGASFEVKTEFKVTIILLSGNINIKNNHYDNNLESEGAFNVSNDIIKCTSSHDSSIVILIGECIFINKKNIIKEKIYVPFNSKRIFFVKNVPTGSHRGQHAHKTESQYLISVAGKVEVELSGFRHEKKYLKPFDSILLPPLLWTDLRKFERKTVLLVFASSVFMPDEYIINKEDIIN